MKKDIEKLQGTWNIVALEVDGQKMPSAGSKIMVKGTRFTTIAMGAEYSGTLVVDATKSPQTFDLKFTSGREKGSTNFGIYELDGDTWKICLSMTGKDRPTKFATKAGSGHALEALQREKPGKKLESDRSALGSAGAVSGKKSQGRQDTSSAPFEPAPELEGEWSMASCVMNGQPLDASMVKYGKRVARGNEMSVSMAGQVILKARFRVDRTKEPMTIDYALLLSPNEGKMQQGIYALEGKTLRTCFSSPGQARPDEFASVPGDGRTLAVWKLEKK